MRVRRDMYFRGRPKRRGEVESAVVVGWRVSGGECELVNGKGKERREKEGLTTHCCGAGGRGGLSVDLMYWENDMNEKDLVGMPQGRSSPTLR